MLVALLSISLLFLAVTGCSSSSTKKQAAIYAAGDKAKVGALTYNVTDTEVRQELGDDPNTARTPQNRFFLISVSISNSSSGDEPIPAMTLVDDAGQSYTELADGTNVPHWLGLVRKVAQAGTEQGAVVFDAPSRHYRLRLNDPLDEQEISIDIPLNFVHEEKRVIDDPAPAPPHEMKLPTQR
jgi:hypothetical protein